MDKTDPATWLIEVQSSPRRIVPLQADDMLLKELETTKKRYRWARDYGTVSYSNTSDGTCDEQDRKHTIFHGEVSLDVSQAFVEPRMSFRGRQVLLRLPHRRVGVTAHPTRAIFLHRPSQRAFLIFSYVKLHHQVSIYRLRVCPCA